MSGSVAFRDLDRRLLFVLLVATMVIVAIGHLYLIQDLTALVLGLPVWLWVHVGVVIVLLVIAWVATGVVSQRGS